MFVASASTESPGAYPSWVKGTVVSFANPCRSEDRKGVMLFQEGRDVVSEVKKGISGIKDIVLSLHLLPLFCIT